MDIYLHILLYFISYDFILLHKHVQFYRLHSYTKIHRKNVTMLMLNVQKIL